jgi:hypothetical protein
MPYAGRMQTNQQKRIRDALWRLTEPRSVSADTHGTRMPLFARAPYIAVLWASTLVALGSLLALSRVRVPRIARGTVVAVPDVADSVTLLLLLPASSRPFVTEGQRAEVHTGHGQQLVVNTARVEPELLDATSALERFAVQPAMLVQLAEPKVAVRIARCGVGGCLTPHMGETYDARASIGTRSLVSYAVPGS